MSPRVVMGVPTCDHAGHVREALSSLLAQTYRDVAFVVVDDASSDGTATVAAETIAGDPRAALHVNPVRLGLVDNWRRAYTLAREAHPQLEYYAWASDHDLWQPRWLEELVSALDSRPTAVLAYPRDERIDDAGVVFRRPQRDFSTEGVRSPVRRVARAIPGMRAGSMVYGLFRSQALERAGVFRRVLHPDRLLLLELALQGEFVQVPDVLWQRRYAGTGGTRRRQRRTLFAERPPALTYLPSWLVHTAIAATHTGPQPPRSARWDGVAATLALAVLLPAHELRMRAKPARRTTRIALRRARAAVRARQGDR